MPLDLRGFTEPANQWAGLYHASDQLEKRKLRQDQLDLQKQSGRAAAGTFLRNYLDPKDLLTGTTYDPMIIQGLQSAMQQGAQLAESGADAPTLMMALGPMVNKLTQYSTNAKTINKQVDDQIKLMRESGLTGYDYAKLKQGAMDAAFYKIDQNGKSLIDPSEIDPSANYIQKAIEANPGGVTTAAGLDLFAKNSPMQKTLDMQTNYGPLNQMNKSSVHLIGQNWLQPEYDTDPKKKGHIVDLVPKHDIALEGTQPLMHNFTDEQGKVTRAPVRLLKEDVFDDMMKRRPDIADYMNGIVSEHLKEYTDKNGQPITLNSPKAKLIARAIAYDELNRRKAPSIENADIHDKQSPQQVNLNIQSTDKYLQNVEAKAAAAKRGRLEVQAPGDLKSFKRNVGQAFADIYSGKEDISGNSKNMLKGDVFSLGGKKRTLNNYPVVDITSSMPGGGLKSGRGEGFKYGKVYINPEDQNVIVEEISGPEGNKVTKYKEIPKANFGQFYNRIAEANGTPKAAVRSELDRMGYKNGTFKNIANSAKEVNPDVKSDFENRASWRNAVKSPLGKSFQ